MAEHSIALAQRVFLLYSGETEHPIGTCFGVARPGLLLTAAHVVQGIAVDQLRVVTMDGISRLVDKVEHHQVADVSRLFVEAKDTDEHFLLGSPEHGFTDFPLGENVISFGFPQMANERPINPRLMKAHIQSGYPYSSDPYEYFAYELAFPAFPGVSGSPVLRDSARHVVIGLVTEGIHYSSELGEDRTEASWTIAASLAPLGDWVHGLAT